MINALLLVPAAFAIILLLFLAKYARMLLRMYRFSIANKMPWLKAQNASAKLILIMNMLNWAITAKLLLLLLRNVLKSKIYAKLLLMIVLLLVLAASVMVSLLSQVKFASKLRENKFISVSPVQRSLAMVVDADLSHRLLSMKMTFALRLVARLYQIVVIKQ